MYRFVAESCELLEGNFFKTNCCCMLVVFAKQSKHANVFNKQQPKNLAKQRWWITFLICYFQTCVSAPAPEKFHNLTSRKPLHTTWSRWFVSFERERCWKTELQTWFSILNTVPAGKGAFDLSSRDVHLFQRPHRRLYRRRLHWNGMIMIEQIQQQLAVITCHSPTSFPHLKRRLTAKKNKLKKYGTFV